MIYVSPMFIIEISPTLFPTFHRYTHQKYESIISSETFIVPYDAFLTKCKHKSHNSIENLIKIIPVISYFLFGIVQNIPKKFFLINVIHIFVVSLKTNPSFISLLVKHFVKI